MNEFATTEVGADTPAGWEGILDPGERIIWQGRPDPEFHIAPARILPALFGLLFAGFAMFWMVMASQAGGVFWMFGLIHFSVGAGLTAHSLFWDTLRRRRSWYTLTDKRAFIATDLPFKGQRLNSYPITPRSPLSLQPGRGTVIFAREERRGNKGRRYLVDIGFQRIEDAKEVYGLMSGIQREGESRT